ncbi:endophilin-B1 [Clonorchis sinensis]|uniref:Endophilin-B1 n=1 Tax=Clonorchis sinensis TaxID=79923 RepID=G7YT72_CLOSI|nr:endophilin-B1 [Clonorchis sinensis]
MRQAWTQSLIALVESVIQPNIANRVEDMVLKGLDRKKERTPVEEQFGDSLVRIGKEMGQSSPNASAMIKCGQAQALLGKAFRTMQEGIECSYLEWLRNFLKSSVRVASQERDNLDNLRLDLDRAKTLLKRAKDDAAKKQGEDSNANVMACEQQVSEAQTLFDRQCEATKRVLEKCISDFDAHKEALQKLLNAQREYHQSCLDAVDQAMR